MTKSTKTKLTACVVCFDATNFRRSEWAKVLLESQKFSEIYVVYQKLKKYTPSDKNGTGISLEIFNKLPKLTIAFVHSSDINKVNNLREKAEHFFQFTSDANPTIEDLGLAIYRETTVEFNIKVSDIEEAISYITGGAENLPSMCCRPDHIAEWSSLIKKAQGKSKKERQDDLNHLFSMLVNCPQDKPEAYWKLYKFLGSPKPIVYVLDDYNNYIECQETVYHRKPVSESIAKYYDETQATNPVGEFEKILDGFCLILNNLSLAFTIKAPKLEIGELKPSYEELICKTLPLDAIAQDASQIAAFIVDLEWLPTSDKQSANLSNRDGREQWKKMGKMAIDILSERYPEIPSFIFTGLEPSQEIQEALIHGAYWGFHKEESHHYLPKNSNSDLKDISEKLNCITLEQHLTKAADRRYGSYQEVPFPKQLNIEASPRIWQQLTKMLKIQSLECDRGQALKRLIARLLPTAEQVEPLKILSGGKSQAQATFLVSPICQNDQLATRFIKIGPWLIIQKEYLSYQKVIQPRLNSYAANLIHKPILTKFDSVDSQELPWGALMYSLAGFPEDYQNLHSLNELFEQQMKTPKGGDFLLECVQNTLEKVLFPLYQSGISKTTKIQPLWCWLGDVLPSFYTGEVMVLTEIECLDSLDEATANNDVFVIPSPTVEENKEGWEKAFSQLNELNKLLEHKPDQKVLLSGWKLLYIEVKETEKETHIILVHPILGMRVYLKGDRTDICLRFGATWIRPGMLVNVLVCLDSKAQRQETVNQNLSGFDLPKEGENNRNLDRLILENFREVNKFGKKSLPSPLEVFGNSSCELNKYSFLGHTAPIHGDLNLNNILYPATETCGWLIDFERVKEQGLIAFDLAKLEGEIWVNHLFPYLKELAAISPDNITESCYQLLYFCLQALDFSGDEVEFFKTKVKSTNEFSFTAEALLIPVANALRVIKAIRIFGMSKCKLLTEELKWALAAYFFNAARLHFPPGKRGNSENYSAIFAFLASAWHLSAVWHYNQD